MTAFVDFPAYSALPEPNLLFDRDQLHPHPLLGLINNGPYGLKFGFPSRLRLALLAPKADMAKLRGIVAELERRAVPKEAKNYYPEYPGFKALLRVPISTSDANCIIELPPTLDAHAARRAKFDLACELLDCIARLPRQPPSAHARFDWINSVQPLLPTLGSLLPGIRELDLGQRA
jgi:hypothetical protein